MIRRTWHGKARQRGGSYLHAGQGRGGRGRGVGDICTFPHLRARAVRALVGPRVAVARARPPGSQCSRQRESGTKAWSAAASQALPESPRASVGFAVPGLQFVVGAKSVAWPAGERQGRARGGEEKGGQSCARPQLGSPHPSRARAVHTMVGFLRGTDS